MGLKGVLSVSVVGNLWISELVFPRVDNLQVQVKVLAIFCDEDEVSRAGPGENLRVRVSGIEEEDILSGFVLCSVGESVESFLSADGDCNWCHQKLNELY